MSILEIFNLHDFLSIFTYIHHIVYFFIKVGFGGNHIFNLLLNVAYLLRIIASILSRHTFETLNLYLIIIKIDNNVYIH
jgi:hypothetical protein